jgi:hypothetical protein
MTISALITFSTIPATIARTLADSSRSPVLAASPASSGRTMADR